MKANVLAKLVVTTLSLLLWGCAHSYKNTRHASQEAEFMRQPVSYYSNLAAACDIVLRLQPIPTDSFVFVTIRKSRLPRIITDLHPRELVLTSKSVSMGYE